MANEEVRARLVYDVSAAQQSLRSLGSDLDKLDRPISLTIVVNDSQLTEAVANVQSLKQEVLSLVGAIALDDSQLTAAQAEVTTVGSELQGLSGVVEVDDTQVVAAEADLAKVKDEVDGLEGKTVLDGAFENLITGAGTAEEYLLALDESLGLTANDAEVAATAADSLASSLQNASDASLAGAVSQLDEVASEAERASSESATLAGSLGTAGEAAGELAGGFGQLSGAGAVAGGELETVGGVATLTGEGFSGLLEKTEGLATAFGQDLGPEAAALIGTLAGLGAAAGVFGTVVDKIVAGATDLQSAEARLDITTKGQAESFQSLQGAGLGAIDTQQKLASVLGSTAAATDQANAKQAVLIEQNTLLTAEQKKQFELNLSLISASATTVGLQQDYSTALEGSIKGLANYQRAGLAYGVALQKQDIEQEQAKLGIEGTFASLDKVTKAFVVSEAAVAKYGDGMRSNVARANEISALSFASIQSEFKNFIAEIGQPLISPALDLIRAAEPLGRDVAGSFADLAKVVLPAVTTVINSIEPLVKIFTDEFATILPEVTPAIQAVGTAIAEAFGDPLFVASVRDLAIESGHLLVEVAPLLPLFLQLGPSVQILSVSLEAALPSLQATGLAIEATLAPLEAIGLITKKRPDEVFKPPRKEDIKDIKDAGEATGELANKASEASLKTAAQKEATTQLASQLRDARVSVDELAKALDDQFKKPTQFSVAEAQAKFIKDANDAQAKAFKEGGLSLVDPKKAVESFALLDTLTKDFQALTDAQIKTGQFDPTKFDVGKQQLIELGKRLGLTKHDLDLFAERINSVPAGKDIQIKATIGVARAELDKLTSVEDTIAFLKANPEVKTDVEVNGTQGLKNVGLINTALDVIAGRKTNAEVGIDDKTQDKADEIDRRMKVLDELNPRPKVTLDDEEANRALKDVNDRLFGIGQVVARPTVTIQDFTSFALSAISGTLSAINSVRVAPTVSVEDEATGKLSGILGLLRGIQQFRAVSIAASVFGSIPGFEHGGISEHHQLAQISEGNKRELILPLEGPWERQVDLLDQAGVLARMEQQFSAEEQTRASVLSQAVAWSPRGIDSVVRPTMADLEAIATRMETAARIIASESRPITAEITVPALHDEHETARILRRKLVRL